MKKAACVLILALSTLPICAAADVDLASMSYDELVELKQQVLMEIMQRDGSYSVTVPIGLWRVGVDIPEGVWLLSAENGRYTHVAYGPTIDENGNSMSKYTGGNTGTFLSNGASWRLSASAGNYIYIEGCPVVFMPADTLSLGFAPDSFSSSSSPASSTLPQYDYKRAYKECDDYKDSFYQFSGHVCEILESDDDGICYYVSATGDYSNCLFLYAPSEFANACVCSPGDMIDSVVYYNGIQTLDSDAKVPLLSAVYINVVQ